MTDTTIPDGFTPIAMRANPFVDPLGPLYGRRDGDGIVVGLRIEERHCNPGGFCHGGMLMTLADMLLIYNSNTQSGIRQFMLTVNLTGDFIGPAPLGSWLEGHATMLRASRNMIFTNGMFTADGEPVLRVNGIFKPTGQANDMFTGDSLLAAKEDNLAR
tara:strand:+ start:286 stop:762 length:477 start_codon:yes stop_codon:yes gene_type:complete